LDPLSSWGICGVNGENREGGADYGESSPRSWNDVSWFDYIEPLENFL